MEAHASCVALHADYLKLGGTSTLKNQIELEEVACKLHGGGETRSICNNLLVWKDSDRKDSRVLLLPLSLNSAGNFLI
jgi:hypothetical protein